MQKTGAWIKLSWDQPITFNQVVLFDRPDSANQVTGGTLTFSDGTFVTIGALQNDGKATYIDLPSVTSQSIVFMVTKVSSTTSSVGLAQFQVFLGDASK